MSTESDMDVSRKLFYLLMLLSGSRVNSISHLKITNMYLTDTECTFLFDGVLKHSKPSFKEKSLVFRGFPQNPTLCLVSTLIQHLDLRLSRSSDAALFLTRVRSLLQCKRLVFFSPIAADRVPPVKPMVVVPALQQYYSQQIGLELLPSKSFI